MSRKPVVIGLDLGTTSAKAVAYDAAGAAVARADRGYAMHTPRAGWAEQDPDEVVDASLAALQEAATAVEQAGATAAGVSVSAAMHSLLAVGPDGRPLTAALTYADGRAAPQVDALRRDPASAGLFARTGTPLHPMSPLAKLRWFAANEAGTFGKAAGWWSLKTYLLSRLSGRSVVDHSIASGTGLYALADRDWDADALAAAGVEADQLGTLVPTDAILAARAVAGLPEGLPVVAGAADGCLANLGAGAVTPDVGALTIGTSGAIRSVTDRPDTDAAGRLFTYVLAGDRWVTGAPISNGGLVLQWLRDNLQLAGPQTDGDAAYVDLLRLAAQAPPGAAGVRFLPYLTGERAPQWGASAGAMIVGLGLDHDRRHVARAALESVALQLRWLLRLLADRGVRPVELRATGGFTRSEWWLQLTADVLGVPLVVPREAEGTCLGAALLGMTALGWFESLDAAAAVVEVTGRHEPQPAAAAVYDRLLPEFVALAEAAAPGPAR